MWYQALGEQGREAERTGQSSWSGGGGGGGPKMRISLLGRPCGQPASPVEARKEGKEAGTLLQFALGELWLDVKG